MFFCLCSGCKKCGFFLTSHLDFSRALCYYMERSRRCSSMAECQLPKLNTGVRFPSPAPEKATSFNLSLFRLNQPLCIGEILHCHVKIRFSGEIRIDYAWRNLISHFCDRKLFHQRYKPLISQECNGMHVLLVMKKRYQNVF